MAKVIWIRGISGRGFRVKNSSGAWKTCKEGIALQVDAEVPGTREILSRERDNFIRVANGSDTTPLLKGLSRRGFRIRNQAGAQDQVQFGQAAVEIDLANGGTKRTLKRSKREFIYPGASDVNLVNVYGLQSLQASFRVTDPTLTIGSGNAGLTFVPKVAGGENISISFVDLGVDNATEDVSVTDRAIQVSLAVTQAVAGTAVLSDGASNVTDGDTVTINDVTYRFKDTMAQANDVKREAAGSDATLAHLIKAVNQTGTAGVDYFAGTVAPTNVTAGALTGTSPNATITFTAGTGVAAATVNAYPSTEASTNLSFADTSFNGAVDYDLSSTATEVKTAIEAHTGAGEGYANNLVTVSLVGNGSGEVALTAPTALGEDPEPLAAGETVSVDVTDPFNVAQLRRHFRAWVEA